MKKPNRIELLDAPLDCVNMQQSLEVVDAMVNGNSPQTIIAVNPEKIIKAQQDKKLLEILQSAGLLIPDGIGAVLAAKILYGSSLSRVPGSELMPNICAKAARKGYKLFLLGAKPETNEKAVTELQTRYPGINIVGNHHGYFKDNETSEIIRQINILAPDIVFVALGSPRQELWLGEHLSKLNVKVCQGVGGTFDVIAGNVKRAPLLFRQLHLEWLYRLSSQPKRLLRQTALPKFAYLVLRQKIFGADQ